MTIKITFDSFAEMMRYADRLKNGTLFDQTGKIVDVDDKPSAEPQHGNSEEPQAVGSPIPYGRQIAPHFPDANASMQLGAVSATQQAVPPQQQAVRTSVPVQQQAAQPQAHPATPLAAVPGAVPTAVHEYTQDDLARAAMQLMDKGGMQQLQQLLAGYGCETLQQLPKEQYGNFATALRGMGAQI